MKIPPRISVIIPVLNEEAGIALTVQNVRGTLPDSEVIMVDGGSSDATAERAENAGAKVIRAERGRGRQCRVGAAQATGQILLFLHADTLLPQNEVGS